jgi:hypothetical protein
VPQLRISIAYDIPEDIQQKGQYRVDSFPEENHNPFSDHNDSANVHVFKTHKPALRGPLTTANLRRSSSTLNRP